MVRVPCHTSQWIMSPGLLERSIDNIASPEDQLLLGINWQGKAMYTDIRLPFVLRSAPIIFTALMDALEWIVKQHSSRLILFYYGYPTG